MLIYAPALECRANPGWPQLSLRSISEQPWPVKQFNALMRSQNHSYASLCIAGVNASFPILDSGPALEYRANPNQCEPPQPTPTISEQPWKEEQFAEPFLCLLMQVSRPPSLFWILAQPSSTVCANPGAAHATLCRSVGA